MKIKYQIFISSTYDDLKDVREQLIKCVLEMGHIPVGMEMFSAANEEQWKIIQKQIDECDYYIVIIAHRYGSLDKDISFTEKEYDYAVSKDIPVLGFIIDDAVRWPPKFIDSDEITKNRLQLFKTKVRTRMINIWKNSEDLYAKAAISIGKAFSTYERPGYVRSSEVANIDVYNELTRLSTENANLRGRIVIIESDNKKQEEKEEIELVSILSANTRVIPIKFSDSSEWNRDYSMSLLEIFESLSKHLLIDADEKTMKNALALDASGRVDYQKIPVPTNRFKEWVSDLYSLELIEASERKHPDSDRVTYWTISSKGRELIKKLKKIKLLKGITDKTIESDSADDSDILL
jgi:uncharacterized protein YdaT